MRSLTRRSGGRSPPEVNERLRRYLMGWKAYFGLAQTPRVIRDLDEWLCLRMRAIQFKHWRRGTTRSRELNALGASDDDAQRVAANSRRWRRDSPEHLNRSMPIVCFDRLGLPRFS